MEKAVITANDLCIGYRQGKQEKRIHEHLSFRLYPGELTCLLGANGTGKSTLLRTLAASQPALSGELFVQEKPLSAYSEKERSRTIGVVLTDKTQAGGLTVYELVALGRQPHTGFFGRLNKTDHSIIEEALEAVSISPEAASAAPHSNAVTACGRRDSQIIKAQLFFSTSFPMRVFHTAPAGILIEPNQRFAAINTRMRTDSAMPYIYPFAFVLIISSILIVFCNTSAHSLPTVKGEIF